MKQTVNILIQLNLTAELVKQVGLAGVGIKYNAGATGQVLSQGFAELAQFDQRGVWIAGKCLLGRARKLQEYGVVLLEKGEVTAGCHDRSFGFVSSQGVKRFFIMRKLP